jgi:predicted AAA+ superfamily ATPase
VSFFNLNTLSVREVLSAKSIPIQQILYKGGWPELHAVEGIDPKEYLDNYISSYIEKDIILSAGIQKRREFLRFIQLLAGRVGNLLDLTGLGREVGVEANTIRDWISVLEQMHIIALVPPYHSNLSSRLVKSPKVYFLDTGLACRLQGWTESNPILTSPQQGGLFKSLVYSEIHKLINNHRLDWKIWHWRSRDGEEIDFLLQLGPQQMVFVEAKVSPQKSPQHTKYSEVKKVFKESIPDLLVCYQEGERVLNNQVPIRRLGDTLLQRQLSEFGQ